MVKIGQYDPMKMFQANLNGLVQKGVFTQADVETIIEHSKS